MGNTINITGTKVLSENKFSLKLVDYQIAGGDKTTDKRAEVYFRPDAAAVLLYNEEQGKIMLTSQFRLPAYLNSPGDGYITEACAGLIDDGETPEQTARREAREELGYTIDELKKVGIAYSSAGGITEKVHLFIAPYNDTMKTGEGGGLKEEKESIEISEINIAEAEHKLKNGDFNDMKTIILLQHYFLNKR
jgi:nudix-type nucleoside diphosphatase (YffH/AdpP family)